MANLENEFILIAGSISKKTEKASIDFAHDFTRAVTKSVLAAQGAWSSTWQAAPPMKVVMR